MQSTCHHGIVGCIIAILFWFSNRIKVWPHATFILALEARHELPYEGVAW